MDFVIRPARSSDLPAVIALVRALADFEKLEGPDAEAESRFFADFEAKRFELLVAEREVEVVGYALYFMTYSTFLARPSLFLEDLFVRPDARRLGIGTAFLRELARRAVEAGCGRFEWAVLDWNHPAQQFYFGLGAELLAAWRVCRIDGAKLSALATKE
ncbi:MAG TPA: GNAT family N-acetyltransferase [Polyangiaceae bacterium]